MENINISDKFKYLIDEKYKNNYIFNITSQNSDIFFDYFCLKRYDKENILRELETEEDPLATLFLNLIKFENVEKKEKYNNSKICLELLKNQENIFYQVIFEIYVYDKLIDILKEIKNIRKDEVDFLDNFIFSLYKNIEKKINLSNCISNFLFFLGKESPYSKDIINNETNKVNDLSNIRIYKVILDNYKLIEEELCQKTLVEYIEKLVCFIEKDEKNEGMRNIFLLEEGMGYLNKLKKSGKKIELSQKTKCLIEVLIKNIEKIELNSVEKEIEIGKSLMKNSIEELIKSSLINTKEVKNLKESINYLDEILENELKSNNYIPNQGLIKFVSYLKIGDSRIKANEKDDISDYYTSLTDYIFSILINSLENPIFNSCETKKLIYIQKNEEMKGFLEEIIENYFNGNYFTCCSAISPTIERLIRNTYVNLGKSDIELYGKDNSLQKRKNLDNLLKDDSIENIYGKEFINYFSWLFNNDISYYNFRNSVCHGYKSYEKYNKLETTLQLFILILFLKKFYEYFDKIEESEKE